ncbi:MAG: helix-turn-helix domain-containing protein [Chloroflexi bacterium]|nr:helix-turn-helix domain-containing protein [Chloroflexota bacterium]
MTGRIMNELLTTKQVQDYLKVDRTTIYRMLKDGRLNGIKVGKQWRFPRSEIEGLSSVPVAYSSVATSHDNALPLECVQTVQDVTADTMEVGAVVTDEDGFPLTAVSNSSRFCQLIRLKTTASGSGTRKRFYRCSRYNHVYPSRRCGQPRRGTHE